MFEKLIKDIKQKKPTLQELKIMFKKNNIKSRKKIHELIVNNNLLKYTRKNKQFMNMKHKADTAVKNAYKELSGSPFKNAMKSLKKQLKIQSTKKRSRTKRQILRSKIHNIYDI